VRSAGWILEGALKGKSGHAITLKETSYADCVDIFIIFIEIRGFYL